MFEFCCVFCNEKLLEPGAIIISPPLKEEYDSSFRRHTPNNASNTHKFHVCIKCFEDKIENNFV